MSQAMSQTTNQVESSVNLAEPPVPLVFTDSAAAKVADLIAEEGNPDLKLRVFVQGGGCSGFQYGFTLMTPLMKMTLSLKKWSYFARRLNEFSVFGGR